MKAALRLFKKHPIALGFYLLFVFMWLRIITLNIELSGQANFINSSQRVMRGEGLGYLTITAVFISAAFAFVICVNAVARSKEQTPFYLWMIALIIVPVIIIGRILTQ